MVPLFQRRAARQEREGGLKKTQFDKLKALLGSADEAGTIADMQEMQINDEKNGAPLYKTLTFQGYNGFLPGQKGHKESYLSFVFDLEGRLQAIETWTPSIKTHFSF
jgi:hypothetical protein